MGLKKGLITIWRDLEKKNKKQTQKQNKTSVHTKEVSINDGSGDGQMICQRYTYVR